MHLPKCLERYRSKIEEISDERGMDQGYWVYLIPGWQNSFDPSCHIIHEDNPTQCSKVLRYIEPCDCNDCKEIIARRGKENKKK
jgi:hypothetical protein